VARVALGDDDGGVGDGGVEGVDRADVIAGGVGEEDRRDRLAELLGGAEDRLRGAGQAGVDDGPPLVLLDQVDVDEAETGDAVDGQEGLLGRLTNSISLTTKSSRSRRMRKS